MVRVSLPDGSKHLVEADVFDVGRRLRDGDPTLGWEGDPSMSLCVNQHTGMFEVWARDHEGQGEPYLAGSWAYCDNRVITAMAAGHWKRARKVFQDMIDASDAKAAEADYQSRQHTGAIAEKLAWAGTRDLGIHDFTSFYVPGGNK